MNVFHILYTHHRKIDLRIQFQSFFFLKSGLEFLFYFVLEAADKSNRDFGWIPLAREIKALSLFVFLSHS